MFVPQISAFGDDTRSDGGDVWMIEWDGKAKHWKQDAKVGRGVHCRLCAAAEVLWVEGKAVLCSAVAAAAAAAAAARPGATGVGEVGVRSSRSCCPDTAAVVVAVIATLPLPLLLLLLCQVKLKHKDTGMFLSSSKNLQFGQPIVGHQEVSGVPSTNKDTEWYAAEGVYLPRTDSKKKAKVAADQNGAGAAAAAADKGKDEL